MTASLSARLPADHAGVSSSDARERSYDRAVGRAFAESGRIFLVWLAVYAGYLEDRTPNGLLTVSLLAAAWIFAFRSAFAAGHYTVDSTITVAIGTVTGLVLASALNEWVPGLGLTVPRLLATAAAIFGLVSVWEWLVRRAGVTQWRVLVVGSPGIADALVEEVRRTRVPFDVVGTVGNAVAPSSQGVPLMGALGDLPTIVETVHPELIVLADSPECDDAVERLLEIPRRRFRVVGLSSFYEWAFGRVPVPYLTPSWFMSLIHLRQRVSARWSKRTFDVAVASFALVVLAPVLLVVALLVATTDGPIIFRQTRIGERGRLFTIYKFRTMSADAESVGGPVWASAGDPRATRIGRLLRRTHLDELPQLLNVLRGDMSIVGPRPERPEFIELLEGVVPSWGRRLLVKPGMTGWAQVRSGYAADCDSTAVKLSYDLWYLRHRNLVIDLAVCAKTFFVVLGLGPHERRIEPPGAPPVGRAKRRTLVTPSVGAALVLCLTGLGANRSARPTPVTEAESALPQVQPPAPPLLVTPPRPPSTYRVPARGDAGLDLGRAPSGTRSAPGAADRPRPRHVPQPATLPEPSRPSPLRSEARHGCPRGGPEPRRERRTGRWSRPRDRVRRQDSLQDRRRGDHRGLGYRTKLRRARLDAEGQRSRFGRNRGSSTLRADPAARRCARVLELRRRRGRQRSEPQRIGSKVLDLRPRRRRRLAARSGLVGG